MIFFFKLCIINIYVSIAFHNSNTGLAFGKLRHIREPFHYYCLLKYAMKLFQLLQVLFYEMKRLRKYTIYAVT